MFKNSGKINLLTTLSIFLFYLEIFLHATLPKNDQMNLQNSNQTNINDNLILKRIKTIEQQILDAKKIITNKNKIKELDKIDLELNSMKLEQTKEQSSTAMFILGPLETIYSVAKDRDIKYKLLQISNKLGEVLEPKNTASKKPEHYTSLNKSIKNNDLIISGLKQS